MNTKLKIICILLGVGYLAILGTGIVLNFKENLVSFNEGGEAARMMNENEPKIEWLYINLQPKDYKAYTELVFNKKTGKIEKGEIRHLKLKIENPPKIPTWITVMYVFFMMFLIFYVIVIIWIPVLLFKFIFSFLKKGIFDEKNILRLTWMGWGLIIVFLFEFLGELIHYLQCKALVELNDYNISFSFGGFYLYLMFGLVILLFAEVLKISVKMKEEVDLTV